MIIAEYKTVSAASTKELDNAVNRHLKQGFQPYGTPYVAGVGSQQTIYQALVRNEGTASEELQGERSEQPKIIQPPAALAGPTPDSP